MADVGKLQRLLLEDADELLADDHPLRLRLVDPGEPGEESLAGVDVDQLDAEALTEGVDDLLGLALAQQAVVDEDAGELLADRPVHERGGGGRVDPAGEPADHAAVADLGADPLDLLVDHRGRRPLLLAARDLAQEPLQDRLAVRGMDHLGMELDAVEPALGVLAGGDRRARAGGEGAEPRRRLVDAVAMAHPALLRLWEARHQPTALVEQRELGPAELAALRALDPTAEGLDHDLHPVTDAEHRDVELEQLGAQRRGPGLVDRGRAAGEDEGPGIAQLDPLDVGVVREQLGEDPALTEPARDQLRVLAAEVEHEDLLAIDADRARLAPGGIDHRRIDRPHRRGRLGRHQALSHGDSSAHI